MQKSCDEMQKTCVEEALKKLRNDKERIAFLEDYKNTENGWELWKKDLELLRNWWTIILPDGCMFVVEEELRTIKWPRVTRKWIVLHWYIIPENAEDLFADYVASRTLALNKLKEIGKMSRERGSR